MSQELLSNKRQLNQIDEKETTSFETVNCKAQYVNDLKNASNLLISIIFADDTNRFFTHQDIRCIFKIVNQELEKSINGLFQTNFH